MRKQMRGKQGGRFFWFGIFLCFTFLILAIFGSRLAPIDPMERHSSVIFEGEKRYIPSRDPVPPFVLEQFPLGTDNAGRDLLSRLLWAIQPTLILALTTVLVRIFVGMFIGLVAGWYGGRVEQFVDLLVTGSLAIPPLIFCLAFIALREDRSLTGFVLAMGVTGWADTAVFVKNQTQMIRQATYIEGARTIGASNGRILWRYIFPQMFPYLPTLLMFELSTVILLVAELGFLGMFIGEPTYIFGESPNDPGVSLQGVTAGLPELSQMLSDFWSKIVRTPWEIVIVGGTIFLQILGFNLVGEGLKRRLF